MKKGFKTHSHPKHKLVETEIFGNKCQVLQVINYWNDEDES